MSVQLILTLNELISLLLCRTVPVMLVMQITYGHSRTQQCVCVNGSVPSLRVRPYNLEKRREHVKYCTEPFECKSKRVMCRECVNKVVSFSVWGRACFWAFPTLEGHVYPERSIWSSVSGTQMLAREEEPGLSFKTWWSGSLTHFGSIYE